MAASIRLVCGLTLALTSLAAPAIAQGPGRPPKRVAPTLDAVLPLLNQAVVRVRAPSEAQLAAGDATLEAARDGVATTELVGIRVTDESALLAVPGTGALPASFDTGHFGAWMPAAVVAADPAQRLVLLRMTARPGPAPKLEPADLPAGADFVVAASSVGATLDIQTVWLEPGAAIDLPPGAVVFAVDGRFLGLVADGGGTRRILAGRSVLERAAALQAAAPGGAR